jgi:hypothetical protein
LQAYSFLPYARAFTETRLLYPGFRDGSIHTDAPHPVQVNLIYLHEAFSVQTDACCTRSGELILHFADPV